MWHEAPGEKLALLLAVDHVIEKRLADSLSEPVISRGSSTRFIGRPM